jgi:succinyl-CoA synthetase alpha subunit
LAILVNKETRVLVQGITGRVGSFQTKIMIEYGTKVVAGVTPGKGGTSINGVPVYDLVEEALVHEPNVAISFVPGPYATDAAFEAIDAGLDLIVLIPEGIPNLDVLKLIRYAKERGTLILGPDTPGVISPGKAKVGGHPHRMFMEGNVGVISKSGSLSYDTCKILTENGIGQSTVVGIGGGPIWGLTEMDVLEMFERDDETQAIVLLGEVGGTMEERAADYIKDNITKPVVAVIVGRHAPLGKRMGHAGAIIERGKGSATSKINALKSAGVLIAKYPRDVPKLVSQFLKK